MDAQAPGAAFRSSDPQPIQSDFRDHETLTTFDGDRMVVRPGSSYRASPHHPSPAPTGPSSTQPNSSPIAAQQQLGCTNASHHPINKSIYTFKSNYKPKQQVRPRVLSGAVHDFASRQARSPASVVPRRWRQRHDP